MKNIFTEQDITAGMLIIKETSPRGSSDLSFARTVTYKIGFGHFGKSIVPEGKSYKTDQEYCLISVLTDGMVIPCGHTKEQMAEKLNVDSAGYRPLTKEEYIAMINSSNQGFY